MGVAVVMVEKRPSGAEKEPRRGDLSPDRGGRSRAAASLSILIRQRRLFFCFFAFLTAIQIHIFADIDNFFSQNPLEYL